MARPSVRQRIKYYVDTGTSPKALTNDLINEYGLPLPDEVIATMFEMIQDGTLTIGHTDPGENPWVVVTEWNSNTTRKMNADK